MIKHCDQDARWPLPGIYIALDKAIAILIRENIMEKQEGDAARDELRELRDKITARYLGILDDIKQPKEQGDE